MDRETSLKTLRKKFHISRVNKKSLEESQRYHRTRDKLPSANKSVCSRTPTEHVTLQRHSSASQRILTVRRFHHILSTQWMQIRVDIDHNCLFKLIFVFLRSKTRNSIAERLWEQDLLLEPTVVFVLPLKEMCLTNTKEEKNVTSLSPSANHSS